MFMADLLASLDVEEKARAKDNATKAREYHFSTNVMQQAGNKKKRKPRAEQTTRFKKKKKNMDDIQCLWYDGTHGQEVSRYIE